MPYKNPEDRAKSRANYFPVISVRISKTEEAMYEALSKAASNISVPEYLRIAAREKLIRDGYLTPEDK